MSDTTAPTTSVRTSSPVPPASPTGAAEAPRATRQIPPRHRPPQDGRSGHSRRWVHPLLLCLLVLGTIGAYLVNLTANGWANSFYAAAVQAGTENWEAFLYGSLDAANAITVDKPPASLWLMALSTRVFGFSSFAMLLPQVLLAGVTVLLLVHSTRLALRDLSPRISETVEKGTALAVGLVFALSPVAALMFRFNNPDALLVALMALAVVSTQHALTAINRRGGASEADTAEAPGRVTSTRTTRPVRTTVLWLVLAGVALGLGFLTKQFQVLLITPGLLLAWLLFSRGTATAPVSWLRRILLALVPVGALLVSAGWWIALVELVPASIRPYIGGSQTDSFLELTFGYNGLGRLTGNETGSVGGGGGNGGGGWGETGITRLFTGSFGTQAGWLLPTALALLGLVTAVLVVDAVRRVRTARGIVAGAAARLPHTNAEAPRISGAPVAAGTPATSVTRGTSATGASAAPGTPVVPGTSLPAALVLWGGWLLVTWLTLSFMSGIVHEYYTVALTPALAFLVVVPFVVLWHRRELWVRFVLAVVPALTGAWQYVLVGDTSGVPTWLRITVLVAGVLASLVVVVSAFGPREDATNTPETETENADHKPVGDTGTGASGARGLRIGTASVLLALLGFTALAIPAQLTVRTIAQSTQGSIVTIAGSSQGGPGGGMPGGGTGGGPGGMLGGTAGPGGTTLGDGTDGVPAAPDGTVPGGASGDGSTDGSDSATASRPGGGGGMGGLLGSSEASEEMQDLLLADAEDFTWVAAAIGANNAAGYQLSTEEPVMAIGGFNGTDPSPTLAEFQQYVASGQIHYFIGSGGGPGGGMGGAGMGQESSTASEITAWVESTFTAIDVDGTTVYDLTGTAASAEDLS